MAKKEKIKSMFDNIAPDYDKLNHIMSLNIDKGWRRKAVREIADTDKPLAVLDVACGTGDFTIVPLIYLALHIPTWRKLIHSRGAALNPLLGRTAINLFIFTILLLVMLAVV